MSPTAPITVLLFSHLRYALGMERVELDYRDGMTVSEVEQAIRRRLPSDLQNIPLLTAVNETYRPPDERLKPGDTVALIPPVQGG